MNKKLYALFSGLLPVILLSSFLFLLSTSPVSAATMKDIFPTGYWATKGLLECSQQGCTLDDLIQTALNFVSFGMTLALFVGAPILFAYGGVMILISGGSPDKLGQGKKILTGTLIGALIVLCAYLIIKTFVSLLGISGIGGFS
ncbi:MAG: hypothetical protein AAB897_02700 [Patescibacteria group bacterium]